MATTSQKCRNRSQELGKVPSGDINLCKQLFSIGAPPLGVGRRKSCPTGPRIMMRQTVICEVETKRGLRAPLLTRSYRLVETPATTEPRHTGVPLTLPYLVRGGSSNVHIRYRLLNNIRARAAAHYLSSVSMPLVGGFITVSDCTWARLECLRYFERAVQSRGGSR